MDLPSSLTSALPVFRQVAAWINDAPSPIGAVTRTARIGASALIVFGAQTMAAPATAVHSSVARLGVPSISDHHECAPAHLDETVADRIGENGRWPGTVEKVSETSTKSAPLDPIKIAVFDFELEDFSAGAGIPGKSEAEAAQLTLATAKARELIAQSGRYRLVDVTAADAKAVTDHTLRNCNGCDAEIALKLGAEQSLVGVITKISMTEYTVQNQIRDSRTGNVVARIGTDLRMGADYSWNRGAAWLIQNRLLGKPD
jgi:hypothetical protein